MTAQHRDSRLYDAPRERIFQACRDAIQPCGFSIRSTNAETFTVEATASYDEKTGPDAGLLEELSVFAFKKLLADRFGANITLTVDEDGRVHAASVSRPRTIVFDQGLNRENILSIWRKMDQYLLYSPTVVNDHSVNDHSVNDHSVNDHSVNVGNNSGIVQNDSVGDVSQRNDFGTRSQSSPSPADAEDRNDGDGRWDVGVITVLSEETQAVLLALGLRVRRTGGLHFYEGETDSHGTPVKVVATRTLEQGNRSIMAAHENLRRRYDPKVFVLVGIGGAIRPEVAAGDVVVADRVVYYDLRKETPEGTQRRGEERAAPAGIGHAVNAFFTDHDPAEFAITDPAGTVHDMRMWTGPLGSGEAVIADHEADILKYLAAFNDKILAVDMEAGGLSAACHEQSAASGQLQGWVVIRGISDDAGAGKHDDHHRLASWHAAEALRRILPYLVQHSS